MITRSIQPRMIFLIFAFLFCIQDLYGQESDNTGNNKIYKHAKDFSPLSPLFRIYALQYNYRITPKNELILGAAYTNIQYDFGNTNAVTFILGYRRYIFNKVHLEYQLWFDYDRFYEKNELKYYNGFDLWNEFRLGYHYDFKISQIPCFINFQWPFGFGLYAENKPESFKKHERKNRFFYFPPMFFIGVRF